MNAIDIEGAGLAYAEAGAGETTLLLVHGFPLSHAMWAAQLKGLAPACRVVAPDLRGYGESPLAGWPAPGEAPGFTRYADDLAALIGSLETPGPVVLVGFSMGGYIAFEMLRRHAGAFGALVLIDTKAAADTDDARATRLKMADGVADWGAARVAELMRPNLFAVGTPEPIVDETVAVISATDPAAIAASQRAMAARPDSTSMLGSIDKPTLVVCGEHDAITPPEGMRDLAAAIPGARYVEISGAGHMAPVEKPEAVNAALRGFIEDL